MVARSVLRSGWHFYDVLIAVQRVDVKSLSSNALVDVYLEVLVYVSLVIVVIMFSLTLYKYIVVTKALSLLSVPWAAYSTQHDASRACQ